MRKGLAVTTKKIGIEASTIETSDKSFQDQGSVMHCFGCGANNQEGMRIKSFWNGDAAICTWRPDPKYCGGAVDILYGGTIASLIDCHSVNLAVATEYKQENRPIGSEPKVQCVSANLNVNFRKPIPLGKSVTLEARILKREGRKTWVSCVLSVEGQACADGEVLAIRLKTAGL
jgi:acyl-coenzyme A thioesterase PaaI-like protein